MDKKTLTVFTPTYNREKLLPRLYESLLSQSGRDFEWLIVDDGSTDGTEELVKSWIRDGSLQIRYYKKKNGGKMKAHNRGVALSRTELFVCLDSDDYFTRTAVDDILREWRNASKYPFIAGIAAHKGRDEEHPLYGVGFPERAVSIYRTEDTEPLALSTLRCLYLAGFKGETTLIFRTEILKRFLFPEIPGEKYVPEDYVYDKIDRYYKLLILPKVLTVCEVLDSGYTGAVERLRRENPTGWYLYYLNRSKYTAPSLLKLKYMSHCLMFRRIARKKTVRENPLPFILGILGLPGAVILTLLHKL